MPPWTASSILTTSSNWPRTTTRQSPPPPVAGGNSGDFTYDGIVDFNDLVKLAQNYNTALPSAPVPGASANFNADWAAAIHSVPEPTGDGSINLPRADQTPPKNQTCLMNPQSALSNPQSHLTFRGPPPKFPHAPSLLDQRLHAPLPHHRPERHQAGRIRRRGNSRRSTTCLPRFHRTLP